ncbi:hypothetical protein fh0823_13120 [Francisella halioticida]|uniref:DUF2971 domain-containing protein n=1 Tax=Francisella halioticida TaxID=549298 RepID=A0ABM6M0H7_9GAMM|nr:DUF2971 domain-containing protein [Francisella halioticida]ASG68327.1 hypothetical protein CDV26_07945 [Francisella halioticida]BCD91173.1 hypothetical protein fh0823_13120 [Francisella halioticida]
MGVYKYLSEERVDVLENNTIRFTQPVFLNDPFETQVHLKALASVDELQKLSNENFDKLLSEEISKHNHIFTNVIRDYVTKNKFEEALFFFIQLPELKQTFKNKYNESLNNGLGILSLSSKNDNLLMWAHYANSHQGFVMEFDDQHEFFNQKLLGKDCLRSLREVIYSKERPSRLMSEYNEYRMILPLTDAAKNINDEIYLFKYPKEIVRSVYFGVNMNSENKKKNLNLIKNDEELNHIQLFQAFPSDKYYRVEFKSYSE